MQPKLKIYLDTSVINFLFADDAPHYQADTILLFENFIKTKEYDTFISDFVLIELQNNPNEAQRLQLLNIIIDYDITILENTADEDVEIRRLADDYLNAGVVPPSKLFDALHIATSVFNNMDYLVSWNFKHLANVKREMKAIAVNYANGYIHNFHIVSPIYLINDDLN